MKNSFVLYLSILLYRCSQIARPTRAMAERQCTKNQNPSHGFDHFQKVNMSNFVSPKAAAIHFGVSRSFIYKLRGKGELDFHYLGGKPFIDLEEVNAKISLSTSKQQNTNKNYATID